MVEMNLEASGQEYALYGQDHGGEEPVSYPVRPGAELCSYYMKTGTCKYADKCKFDHPPDVVPSWGTVTPATEVTIGLNKESYPRRPSEPPCSFFLKTGCCKYKLSCKFDHPPEAVEQTLHSQSAPFPVRPNEPQCSFYMKTGKCKFGGSCRFSHPPMSPEQLAALAAASGPYGGGPAAGGPVMGGPGDMGGPRGPGGMPMGMGAPRGPVGYYGGPHVAGPGMMAMMPPPGHMGGGFVGPPPQRPGEKECSFFLRTGRCTYGPRCKWHHPLDKMPLGGMAPMGGPPPPHHMQMGGPHGPPMMHPGLEGYPMGYGGMPPPHLRGGGVPGGPGGVGDGSALPSRPGQEPCSFYMRTGKCSYGQACRFDHPNTGGVARETSGESGGSGASSDGLGGRGSGNGGGGNGQDGPGAGQYPGGGYPEGAHMQYVGGQYIPVPPGTGANGYMYPGEEQYGSPHHPGGYMSYAAANHQFSAQAAGYGNYRQSS